MEDSELWWWSWQLLLKWALQSRWVKLSLLEVASVITGITGITGITVVGGPRCLCFCDLDLTAAVVSNAAAAIADDCLTSNENKEQNDVNYYNGS